jgi:hypothetical protein
MKRIKILGFETFPHKELSLLEVTKGLASQSGVRINHDRLPRVLNTAMHESFLLGSLWTDRGDKTFTQIDGKTNKMSIRGLDRGKSLSSYNFFILSLKSGRGLVTQTPEGAGVGLLTGFIQRIADTLLTEKRNQAILALGSNPSSVERRKVSEQFRGEGLRGGQLYNRNQLKAVLESMKRLLAVSVRTVAEDNKAVADPLIRTEERRVTFVSDANFGAKVRHILGLVNDNDVEGELVFVEGVNGEDALIRFNVNKIPDWFGMLEVETIEKDPTLFDSDLTNCVVIKKLLGVAQQRPALFS